MIERGAKKSFASALDWPGWSRSGKTPEDALVALGDYAERYAPVVQDAGVDADGVASPEFEVIEEQPGTATTDFGAPDIAAIVEHEPMDAAECDRQVALLEAAWDYFDEVASRVSEELQKGPRGGGRNRAKIIEHVQEAERAYVRNLGVKTAKGAMETEDGLHAHRAAVAAALRDHAAQGEPARKWPLRYFIRRATWHVLDHAWEMEDKDLTGRS